jgi:lysozyme
MKLTKQALELLVHFEGLKLEAYLCSAKVPTIGIGCTYYPDKTPVKIGDKLKDASEAYVLKEAILKDFISGVESALKGVTVTEYEFSACVCLAYNVGVKAFTNSSVCRFLKLGNKDEAAESFLLWNKVAGKVLLGLVRRRYAEMLLFQNKNWADYEKKRLQDA